MTLTEDVSYYSISSRLFTYVLGLSLSPGDKKTADVWPRFPSEAKLTDIWPLTWELHPSLAPNVVSSARTVVLCTWISFRVTSELDGWGFENSHKKKKKAYALDLCLEYGPGARKCAVLGGMPSHW